MGFTPPTRISFFHRWVAGMAAALVLLLTALTASPSAHQWLHEGSSDHEDGCAVVIFSLGVELMGFTALLTKPLIRRTDAPQSADSVFLLPPRFLLQPERGPPARG